MNWMGKIFMGLVGLGLLAGLLLGLGVYTVFATGRWLLTGRKPQVVLVWQRLGRMRQVARWSAGHGQAERPRPDVHGDVVDVQAREVADGQPRLPTDRS